MNGTVQFTATDTAGVALTVTWQVNGTTGGAAATGTISTSGLFTAPAAVPNPSTVTVTAVSTAKTSQTGTATVTILNPTPITVPSPTAVITPAFALLGAGAQQAFSATVNGQPASVAWSLQCPGQTAADCGTISSSGLYTAPLSPPLGGRLNVVATPADTSAKASSVAVDIQFSSATLTGVYVFSAAGSGSSGFLAQAGAIRFDGSGTIVGGVEDSSAAPSSPVTVTGGSYRLGINGRGTAVLQTANGPETWQVVMANHSHGFWLRFDGGGRQASGSLDLQDATPPAIGSLLGKYAFTLDGAAAGGASVAWAGALTADGSGTITRGILDASDGTTVTTAASAAGNYTAPSSLGRGTLTVGGSFGTQTFAYYIVNNRRIKLLEADSIRAARGELVLQPAGPFTNANLNAGFGFVFSGANNHHPAAVGGILVANGAGGFQTGSVDVNDNGAVSSELPLSGSYSVADADSGRTTATWNVGGSAQHLVLYPRTDGGWNLLRLDPNTALHGTALPQIGQAFNLATLSGFLAVMADGASTTAPPVGTGLVGQFTLSGADTFTGTLDISNGAATTPDVSLQASSFAVKPNGRGAAHFDTSSVGFGSGTLVLYVLDSTSALWLELDGSRVLAGIVQRQY